MDGWMNGRMEVEWTEGRMDVLADGETQFLPNQYYF